MGAYAGAARRRVHLVTVLFGLRLAIAQTDARPTMPISFRYDHLWTPVDAPAAWYSHSDLDKKESDGRDPPHTHRGVVGAPELCR